MKLTKVQREALQLIAERGPVRESNTTSLGAPPSVHWKPAGGLLEAGLIYVANREDYANNYSATDAGREVLAS